MITAWAAARQQRGAGNMGPCAKYAHTYAPAAESLADSGREPDCVADSGREPCLWADPGRKPSSILSDPGPDEGLRCSSLACLSAAFFEIAVDTAVSKSSL